MCFFPGGYRLPIGLLLINTTLAYMFWIIAHACLPQSPLAWLINLIPQMVLTGVKANRVCVFHLLQHIYVDHPSIALGTGLSHHMLTVNKWKKHNLVAQLLPQPFYSGIPLQKLPNIQVMQVVLQCLWLGPARQVPFLKGKRKKWPIWRLSLSVTNVFALAVGRVVVSVRYQTSQQQAFGSKITNWIRGVIPASS